VPEVGACISYPYETATIDPNNSSTGVDDQPFVETSYLNFGNRKAMCWSVYNNVPTDICGKFDTPMQYIELLKRQSLWQFCTQLECNFALSLPNNDTRQHNFNVPVLNRRPPVIPV